MASQAQLESQIAAVQAEIATTEADLAALREAGNDPAGVAQLEATLNLLEDQLFSLQDQLQNLATLSDQQLEALGNAQAGPGEISYSAPPTDNTTYFENNGQSSTSTPTPQATPNEPTNATTNQSFSLGGLLGGIAGLGLSTAAKGLGINLFNTRSQPTTQDSINAAQQSDWRVRLSLAGKAKYLYRGDQPGILAPLKDTDGVIFPYTPQVTVSYAANYDQSELTHSNYKIYQYRSSSVDSVSISCDFTAQDTFEANYLLAVIHFFRSVTKMFYGQDQFPKPGTPPPLCYLTGLGSFQFDNHPLAITQFNYSLPTDVDYIRAGNPTVAPGSPYSLLNSYAGQFGFNSSQTRLGQVLTQGGNAPNPQFQRSPTGTQEATYVPTKMQIQISAIPIVTRNDVSNRFSLTDYAAGKLLRGSTNGTGGIW